MKLPRNLDAEILIRHLVRNWQYEVVRQTGSHIRLRTTHPTPHPVTIPAHSPLKPGTLASILKDVAAHKVVTVDAVLAGL